MRFRLFAPLSVVFLSLPFNSAYAEEICETLAQNLHQDVLEQGTSLDQYSQFVGLVSNAEYDDYNNASSSSHTFNGTLSIPDEVDLAIGDGQKSDSSTWTDRRKRFLSMSYDQTSSSYRSTSHSAQTNIGAIQAIAGCAVSIANREGVFLQLVNVSPENDAFSLRLWHNTSGSADWKLTDLSPQPQIDADFGCDNNWEKANNTNPLDLAQQGLFIGCHKNPNKHLVVTVQTTAGPAGSFQLVSNDENIKKLEGEIKSLDEKVDKLSNTLGGEIVNTSTTINGTMQAINGQLGARIGSLENERATVGSYMLTDAFQGNMTWACPAGWLFWGATYIPINNGTPAASLPNTVGVMSNWPSHHVGLCRKN
jgi:hypothetical protein